MFSLKKIDIFKVSVQIVANFSVKKSIRKAPRKKAAKKSVKNGFRLAFWRSGLRFGRPGARPGRPGSVPRAAQDGPKSWGRLGTERFVTLLGALGRIFSIFGDV